jgi:hypothetical protein
MAQYRLGVPAGPGDPAVHAPAATPSKLDAYRDNRTLPAGVENGVVLVREFAGGHRRQLHNPEELSPAMPTSAGRTATVLVATQPGSAGTV